MQSNIFFTNSIQVNFTDYVYLNSYSINSIFVNNFKHSLTLTVPNHLIKSELLEPLDLELLVTPDTYYEDNLSAPREDAIYQGKTNKYKRFYRILDNDLATGPHPPIEYLFDDYIQLKYLLNNKLHLIKIGLPIVESQFNYYIDGVLTSPDFDIILTESKSEVLTDVLTFNNGDPVITNELTEVNNYYKLSNQLATEVLITNISSSEIQVSLIINNSILSQTNNNITLNNYPRINYVDSEFNLEDLAWSIYAIKHSRPNDYLSLLDGIVKAFINQLNAGLYLPKSNLDYSVLENSNYTIPDTYSYYDNSLLILSMLYSYENNYTPTFIKFYEEIITKLISSINIYTNYCTKEVSNNIIPTVINDINTTCLISLILEKYISIKYNPVMEYLIYRINDNLNNIVIDKTYLITILDRFSEDIDKQIDNLFHLGLWVSSRELSLGNIQEIILERVAGLSLNPDINLKMSYLLKLIQEENILSSEINILDWGIDNILENYFNDVYGVIGSNEPNLKYSAWAMILDKFIPIEVESYYRNKYMEVSTMLASIYQKSLKYLPVNEPWFNLDSLDYNKGIIGLLMRSVSETLAPMVFEYICYAHSLDINEAYGYGLDKWGLLVELPRLSSEDDKSYGKRIKALLDIESSSFTEFSDFIESIKTKLGTRVIDNKVTTIIYNNEEYELESVEDLYLKSLENNPNGVYLPTGEFYELDKELGVLIIESYEDSNLRDYILSLRRVYSIPVILKSIKSFTLIASESIYK